MKKTSTLPVDAAALLRATGLRCTKERVQVLAVLMRLHTSCTVDDVHAHVRKDVNRVTLYRMLEQFANAGLVERVAFHDGIKRYEYQHEHHHHVTCTSCGTRARVALDEKKLNEHALRGTATFAEVTSHTLEFFGVCRTCAPHGS